MPFFSLPQGGSPLLAGDGAPASGLGAIGDLYLDQTNRRLYGPKTSSGWGSGFAYEVAGPAGANGINGTNGVNGTNGINGITPTFTVGNVATLAAGSNASVTATTTNNGANVTLNFSLPAGANGAAGGVTTLNGLAGAVQLAAGPNVTISSSNLTLTIDSKASGIGANDAVDGGTYTGTILGGITFTVQPQSQTVSTSSNITFANVANSPARYGVLSVGANLYSFDAAADSGGTTYASVLRSADNGGTWSSVSCVVLSGGVPQDIASLGIASAASNGSRTVVMPGLGTPTTQTNNLAWTGVVYSDDANLASLTQVGGSGSSTFGTNARPYSLAYSATAARWAITTFGNEAKNPAMPDVWSSSDGANWTSRYSGAWGQDIGAVDAAARVVGVGGAFVAMLSRRTYFSNSLQAYKVAPYLYSAAGVSWAETSNPFSSLTVNGSNVDPSQSIDIASSGTRAVAIRRTDVRYTTDGTAWGTATLPVACDRIEYARGLFWAWPVASGTDICTSPDGVTWTLRTRPASAVLLGLAAANGSSVAFLLNSGSTHATATASSTAASANFTVAATAEGGASVSYQWQRSLDAGSTWANIANATSAALNLTGLTTANTAERYRAVASATGAATKNSQSATLTVTE